MDTIKIKKQTVLLLFILLKSTVYAQSDYQAQIDNIFNIPAYKVTTGLLINRSPELIDMQSFDLQSNADSATAVTSRHWLELFYRLYASYLDMNSFPYDITLAGQYPETAQTTSVALGVIYYRYDKFKPYAVSDGLLAVDTLNQQITDISPAGQSPLETDTCLALSALADTVTGKTIDFVFKDSLFVSNAKDDIREIHIDFDDGLGYVRIVPDRPLTVSYSTEGCKTLTAKITIGTKDYYAKSTLYIKSSNKLKNRPVPPTPDVGAESYYSNGILAYYGIWYRCNHDNTIKKPLLVVSGFDPGDQVRIAREESDKGSKKKIYLYDVANKDGFLNRLRELGYDIIIYRSANSTESIVDNAMNLVQFMQEKIIDVKTSDNELIVLGASMGGLVSRYALTYMEHEGIPHKTKLFISMDSPQNGANVPLGFQYMAYYLNKDLFGLVPQLSGAIDKQLGCVAAKQMLVYHYEATTGNTARHHTERTNYLNRLASIGYFPRQCATMAISLGSGIGTTQGFEAGSRLIKKKTSPLTIGAYATLDLLLLTILGIPPTVGAALSSVQWEFEVNAVPNQTSRSIYKENISVNVCIPKVKTYWEWWMALVGLPPIIIPYLDCSPDLIHRDVVVNNTQPLDNAPASIKNWHNLKDFEFDGIRDIFNSLGITDIDTHADGFIPAYSALGLNIAPHTNIKNYLNAQAGVQRLSLVSADYHLYYNNNAAVSPFDYLYIENVNNEHIFDETGKGVFSAELLETMDNLVSAKKMYLENKTIASGQSVAYEASETITAGYSTDNIPTNNGNFTVEPGANLSMKANQIILKSGFHAKPGSTVHLQSDVAWVCPAGSIRALSISPYSILSEDEEMPQTEKRRQIVSKSTEEHPDYPVEHKNDNTYNVIHCFPNPVENILNVQIPNSTDEVIKIKITTINGQIVYSQSFINDKNHSINCSGFDKGVYFMSIEFKNNRQTMKIIKE